MRVTMVGGKNPLKGTRVWINKRHVFGFDVLFLVPLVQLGPNNGVLGG